MTRALVTAALVIGSLLAACSDGVETTSGTTGSGGTGSSGTGTGTGSSGTGGGAAMATPIAWSALPTDGAPVGRYLHTAVWTGKAMLVWGGRIAGKSPVTATGGLYDPSAKAWKPIATAGAPSPRYFHSAVWTGSRMLIWGGYGDTTLAPDGAAYDPESDTWTPIASANQPPPRTAHAALWTGSKMLIWGGLANSTPLGSGGAYDPASNTWKAIPTQGAPPPRFSHAAAWTGAQMIVWGGSNFSDWQSNGRVFDPATASWTGMTSSQGVPSAREGATGAWTGSEFLVWGGWTGGPYENTGGLLSGVGMGQPGTWTTMSITGAPAPRGDHVAVWTGNELVVWGGCGGDSCATLHGDGGRFVPGKDGGSWTAIATQSALGARRGATGVHTGSSIVIWGGIVDAKQPLATGAESPL
jgi:hypothetical protein